MLIPPQSEVGQKREFDKGLIETDAHREGSVCLVVAGGSKRRKLDACEPKANGSRRMLRTGAVTANKASTVLLGHLGTHNITFFTWSVVSVRISSGNSRTLASRSYASPGR